MSELLFELLVGVAGGFLGGMLGVGGGVIFVPAMVLFLGRDQQVAQGVSLVAIIATGLFGGATHLRQGNVDAPVVAVVAPLAVAAAALGGWLANELPADVLQRIFGVVILYVGGAMIWTAWRAGSTPRE
ncbi:MAG TPA: sulfite exporter TauE/SafE family protein [Dehalococcoidia bacterium]|nr:sulfite exporter TauE/SafE family protein [Dehalococcoidia bacterium]